jgi:hypothetical protein
MPSEGEDVTFAGRLFQMVAPATANARSPTVDSRVRGTMRLSEDAERRQQRPERLEIGVKTGEI